MTQEDCQQGNREDKIAWEFTKSWAFSDVKQAPVLTSDLICCSDFLSFLSVNNEFTPKGYINHSRYLVSTLCRCRNTASITKTHLLTAGALA